MVTTCCGPAGGLLPLRPPGAAVASRPACCNWRRICWQRRAKDLKLATASCTGGLIAGLLTESRFLRRLRAQLRHLFQPGQGRDAGCCRPACQHGAVSEAVARAMAEGAIRNSAAICRRGHRRAGPGGGSEKAGRAGAYRRARRHGYRVQVCRRYRPRTNSAQDRRSGADPGRAALAAAPRWAGTSADCPDGMKARRATAHRPWQWRDASGPWWSRPIAIPTVTSFSPSTRIAADLR